MSGQAPPRDQQRDHHHAAEESAWPGEGWDAPRSLWEATSGPDPLVLALAAVLLAAVGVAATSTLPSPLVPAVLLGAILAATLAREAAHSFERFVLFCIGSRPLLDLAARQAGPAAELPSLLGITLIVGSAVWLALNHGRRPPRRASPLSAAAIGLVAAAVVSTLGSPMLGASAVDTLRLVGGLAMFVVVDRLVAAGLAPVRVLRAGAFAAATALVFPVLGPLVGQSPTHVKDGTQALRSLFFLSNNLAHFLVPVALVALGLALRSRGRLRLVASAFFVLCTLEIGLTATRGAWIALLAGLLVIGLLLDRRLVLATSTLAVMAALLVPQVNARLLDLIPDDGPRTGNSLTWRFAQWDTILADLGSSPIIGVGPGVTRVTAGKEPHSEWVRFLVETGALGFVAWLAFVVTAVVLTRRAFRMTADGSEAQGVAAGIAAVVASFMVASVGENLVLTTSYMWYLGALLGIVNAMLHPELGRALRRPGST